jgi:hypothetical protein
MDTTGWLITATFVGPVLGAVAATSLIGAVLRLARARAERIEHVPASGTDLYHNGVPLTEAQFREVWAAREAELDELAPPAERSEWEMKRQFAVEQRIAVLTGTHPHAFPIRGDVDRAWEWYSANNRYVTRVGPSNPWTLQGLQGPAPTAPQVMRDSDTES